jgi:hypothetical protein
MGLVFFLCVSSLYHLRIRSSSSSLAEQKSGSSSYSSPSSEEAEGDAWLIIMNDWGIPDVDAAGTMAYDAAMISSSIMTFMLTLCSLLALCIKLATIIHAEIAIAIDDWNPSPASDQNNIRGQCIPFL